MMRCIVAIDEARGLANEHGIPWQGKVPTDVRYYHAKMKSSGVILMGYGLYKELKRPYEGGQNYVASNRPVELRPGFELVADARKFLQQATTDVWNAGGAILFENTLDLADELYITQLQGDFKCTKFFPEWHNDFVLQSESQPHTENGITFTFQVWVRSGPTQS